MGLETNKVTYKSSWNLIRLKELCTRISDGTHFTPTYVSEGIPFISVKDIYDEKVHFDRCKYITPEAHQELIKRCFPEKDDILITKSGTIGRMALVPDKPEFSLFVSVALLKNKKELIHSKFLKYCLENFLNHISISQDIKGGLLKNFHLEDIRETLIPQVTLEEQQAIISKIEELLSDLDNGKQQLETAQQQLKVYRQSLLKWAFEGRLTNKKVNGELPKGWKLVGLKSITDSIQYGYTESSSKENVGPKFLRITDIQNSKVEWDNVPYCKIDVEVKSKYLLKSGDLVFARTGATVGKSFLIKGEIPEAVFASYLIRVRVNLEMNEKYLSYFFHSPKYWSQITEGQVGIGQPNVNGTKLGQLKISIAPIEEQQRIVDELESVLTKCDKMEETITNSLLQSELLRKSILKKVFEGKLIN